MVDIRELNIAIEIVRNLYRYNNIKEIPEYQKKILTDLMGKTWERWFDPKDTPRKDTVIRRYKR